MLLATLGCLAWVITASAYPPAPHHTFFGAVRNQWGDPLNINGAQVLVLSPSGATLEVPVAASTEPGVNYRMFAPMDSGKTPDLYQAFALLANQPIQLKVLVGSTVYLPIEMALASPQVGQPAGTTRLDLTLGVDSDGDGLPDAWEEALIALLGGTLESITPDGDDDGDGLSNRDEYLAGTLAFDPSDGFRLALLQQDAGNAALEFLAVRGRTYTILASVDLQTWSPVRFRLLTGQLVGPLQDRYIATDFRLLQIEIPRQAGVTHRYFKAVVQ